MNKVIGKQIKALIFISFGLAILFPKVFGWDLFKIILAIFLILTGIGLLFDKSKN